MILTLGLLELGLNNPASLMAAEFRSISPQAIAEISPYQWSNPVVNVTAISGDGKTIAGQIHATGIDYDCAKYVCGVSPFVWSLHEATPRMHLTGPIPLYNSPWDPYPLYVTSLSHDGTRSLVVSEFRHYESAIYTGNQPELLRPSIESEGWLWGADMASDGNVVVGNVGAKPFRWNRSDGLQEIEGLPAGYLYTATAVSGNGQVAVINARPGFTHGFASLNGNNLRGNAYQWSEKSGASELLPLSGDVYSHGVANSNDGATVVGQSVLVTSDLWHLGRAVRWVNGVGTALGSLAEYDWSAVQDVSGDGKLVVGQAYNRADHRIYDPLFFDPHDYTFSTKAAAHAVIWNADGQVFDLKNLLETEFGLASQLDGWQLTIASVVSHDGSVIAGRGIDPAGNNAIWVAFLAIPEPSSATLLVIGAILSTSASRRRA